MAAYKSRSLRSRVLRRIGAALLSSLLLAFLTVSVVAIVDAATSNSVGAVMNGGMRGDVWGTCSSGWPLKSHQFDARGKYTRILLPADSSGSLNFRHTFDSWHVKDGLIARWSLADGRPVVIPLRIVWSALALNLSLFTLFFLVPALSFALRPISGAYRQLRSHCPSCNYDLRGLPPTDSPACPECGHSIKQA